jgi:hypothetical protein
MDPREAVEVTLHGRREAAGDGAAGADGGKEASRADVALPPPAPDAEGTGNGQRPPLAITVAGLTKNYGEIEAVRGIDFEVPTGETFGFLGPNGAGKTSMVCTAPRHRLGRMLISEAFLLLVTTEDGKWLASSPAVPIALAGGLLAELAANGRAAVDDRGRLAPPADPSPLGDPILDQALETFLQEVGKKPKDVLGTVAKGLGDELYERLATAGIVEIHRGRFLRPNRFPVRNPDARARVWDDVAAVLGGTAAPDLRTGTLLGLTQAAGAVPAIFPPERFDMSKKDLIVRAKQVTERDWASGAVSRAIHDAQIATMAAVTAAVTAATTAASISAST